MEQSQDSSRKAHFERQVKVLHEQRKKGVALRRELKKENSGTKP